MIYWIITVQIIKYREFGSRLSIEWLHKSQAFSGNLWLTTFIFDRCQLNFDNVFIYGIILNSNMTSFIGHINNTVTKLPIYLNSLMRIDALDKMFAKIMLPMLKLDTNYGFHELFIDYISLANSIWQFPNENMIFAYFSNNFLKVLFSHLYWHFNCLLFFHRVAEYIPPRPLFPKRTDGAQRVITKD